MLSWGFPDDSVVKIAPVNAGDLGSIPLVGNILWRRKWQPIPVFLPGESHGKRSLVGYSPCGLQRVRYDLVTKQNNNDTLYLETI